MANFDENVVPARGWRFLLLGWCSLMLLVVVLALLPTPYLRAPGLDGGDKVQHVLAFAVLTS